VTDVVAVVHAVATCMLAGLIWFVQVVHYPLMAAVGAREFRAYEERHMRRTTWIVAPLMFVELGGAAWLLLFPPPATPAWIPWTAALLVAVNWLSTALLQVPCHDRLARQGFDRAVWSRLVRSNWIRTVAWTARVPLALALALA